MITGKCKKPDATNTSESTLRGIVLVIALAALWPTAAWAGTIGVPLTDGTLTLQVSGGSVNDSTLIATGPDFSFGAASGPFGFLPPRCGVSDNCSPGSSFAASTGVLDPIGGGVTYAGVSQNFNIGMGGSARAGWTVTAGSIVMPPIGDPFTVTTPFRLDIQVALADCATCFTKSTTLLAAGAGDATFSFAPLGSSWGLTSGVYEVTIPINPVPEPSTWLLVPTAVGLAWLARKKRKANKEHVLHGRMEPSK
jgi:hypothetical protein